MKLLLALVISGIALQSFAAKHSGMDILRPTYWLTLEGDLSGIHIKGQTSENQPVSCNTGLKAFYKDYVGEYDCTDARLHCALAFFEFGQRTQEGDLLILAKLFIYSGERLLSRYEVNAGKVHGDQVVFAPAVEISPILVSVKYSFLEKLAGKQDGEYCKTTRDQY